MDSLGVSTQFNAVYEGDPNHGHRVLPLPSLTPIRLVESGDPVQPVGEAYHGFPDKVFREDDFDPVTKIRRGRVYSAQMSMQPYEWHVHDPLLQAIREVKWADGFAREVRLVTYTRDHLGSLANKPAHALPTVVLGHEPHRTYWKIISIETNLFGTPVVSLRAKHSFGDIPELIEGQVPHEIRTALTEALEKVEGSVNRLSPTDAIDQCRAALSIVFGHVARDRSKDLGPAISLYLKSRYPDNNTKEDLCSRCGDIVAKLHSRGKPNEQHGKDLRPPNDGDAALALECLRFVLVEFGWAR